MNADDRQVIREALESSRLMLKDAIDYKKLDAQWPKDAGERVKEIDTAIALLDKPQPESAGDARELAAKLIFPTDAERTGNSSAPIISAYEHNASLLDSFASRIRSEALERAAKVAG